MMQQVVVLAVAAVVLAVAAVVATTGHSPEKKKSITRTKIFISNKNTLIHNTLSNKYQDFFFKVLYF